MWQEDVDEAALQELAELVMEAATNGLTDNPYGTSCRVGDWRKIVSWCRRHNLDIGE
jgi:hypothetical protein